MKTGYKGTIQNFLEHPERVINDLSLSGRTYCVVREQARTWGEEVRMLKTSLCGLEPEGRIYFEYDIPRIAKRADVVLMIAGIMFVLEFKIDQTPGGAMQGFKRDDSDQVEDYAYDFAYFHSRSHTCPIVPILIDTHANDVDDPLVIGDNNVYRVVRCKSGGKLRAVIDNAIENIPDDRRVTNYEEWEDGVYEPTPTIVQAAEALFADQTVEEITRSGAGAEGIKKATDAINKIVLDAQANNRKIICFLTGVPGAGKTLVGMNLVSSREVGGENRVFLSGNYPLVKVLQEALIRNRIAMLNVIKARLLAGEQLSTRQQELASRAGLSWGNSEDQHGGEKTSVRGRVRRKDVEREVSVKIQLVPHFRSGFDDGPNAPNEHVFVFDESQRAWSAAKLQSEEKRIDGKSEPDILLSYLDRHQDWCVAIALVGSGQDIHDGEAGIGEWYKALANKFIDWDVYIAGADTSPECSQMQATHADSVHVNPALYLKHPMRSFRAQQVSEFVEALLKGNEGLADAKTALRALSKVGEDGRVRFPCFLTRDINTAKQKIRSMAHGHERYGVLMSARAKRLRHYGMFSLGRDFDQVGWFLDGKDSIESSYAMEVAASEFKVQGLEIDYALVGWDGDFMYDSTTGKFVCQTFNVADGHWSTIDGENATVKQRYLTNAYRVILTRARQGMVIFVPTGDVTGSDSTVPVSVYDSTYNFLKSIGITEL